MKQILQDLKTGTPRVADVPSPMPRPGFLTIRTSSSLISAGTERMLLEFGRANLLEKARQQPDKVREVLQKMRTDGVVATLGAVNRKLDQPLALGYCNVGTVLDVGERVDGLAIGDRVVSNGKHAEVVSVPKHLCALIPQDVSDEHASFTVLAAIGLQGIRLVNPTLGECVVVTGLGLVGLLTVQMLRAHGCRVLGVDFSPERVAMARRFGAEAVDLSKGGDPLAAASAFSRGRGVDAVIITASTKSNEPVHQAALMCRKRGRIVLVGVTGLELSRTDFYEKELSFQVSCSYGPGRYDPAYEESGQDYPIGFVRWTEQRNFEAVLDMLADRRLDVQPLISHRFSIENAEQAYELVGGPAPSLGILLQYPTVQEKPNNVLCSRTVALSASHHSQAGAARGDKATVAFVGSGNYATSVLIPAFKTAGAHLRTVASSGGASGVYAGQKFGFEQTTTNVDGIFEDPKVNAVVVSTRHDSHQRLVCQALNASKHVFVEKPLALTVDELEKIETAYAESRKREANPLLMVGFNRRFAPHVRKIKTLLEGVKAPMSFVMTVNAGAIPANHWTQDPRAGGGRILGEACHFIDLLRFLAGVPITHQSTTLMEADTNDTATIQLGFADGSLGTIHYFANGSKSFPKERLEIFTAGRVLQLDNFRKLVGYGWPRFTRMNLWRQDKGQTACAQAFVDAVNNGGHSPIPFDEIMEVSRITVALAEAGRGTHYVS